jgi:glycosyltransferase involved in cell wall biosynthesis
MVARVLFVVPNVPYPLVSGGHLRDWQILNLLARRGRAPALLYFGAGEGAPLAPGTPVDALASSVTFGGARIESPDGGVLGTVARKLAYVTGAATTHPFAYQYDAIGAGEAIVREAARVGAEVVVLRSFWCHEFPRLRAAGLRIVANCPDSNTRLAGEMVRSVVNPAAKVGPLCNLAQVRRLEERYLSVADEIWVPTARERDDVAAHAPAARCLVVANLLDVAAIPDLTAAPTDDDTLLFVASFGYAPNENAVSRLLGRILPAIRRVRPSARLVLAGAGLRPRLRALAAQLGGVETPGFVDDLLPLYRRAAVVLLPVREGAGMLFKTIEALALGKAVVGFPEAYRGIDADAESAFLTARTDAELAERVARLLADGPARRMLGTGARALASTRLSFEHGVRCLDESILAGVGR